MDIDDGMNSWAKSRRSAAHLPRWLIVIALFVFANTAVAQSPGNCEPSTGEAYLDVANVRARIPNNGSLFWRSNPSVYEVPKGAGTHSIFTSGIWIGGMVDGDLRVAATRYGPHEFWSGPINDDGTAPSDCSDFDHVWKVDRRDVSVFDSSGVATEDLRSWPTGLGAPTLSPWNPDGSATSSDGVDNDKDGSIDEAGEMRSVTNEVLALPLANRIGRLVDLAAGERPGLHGDQMLWWIMNDVGNQHTSAASNPIGLEVHASAFAFNQRGDIGNTTFYRYKLYYKGPSRLQDAYFGVFIESDLGYPFDDSVGSDSILGLAITYNADNIDEGSDGYGVGPPALGYDFLQGPVVAAIGDTAIVSGIARPDYRRLQMSTFGITTGGFSEPSRAADYYNYMQAKWKDGSHFTVGGYGNTEGNPPTKFMLSGDAATREFWSEFNLDGAGTASQPADRRSFMSSGPFELTPVLDQDIVFAVVWARGYDNIDSYRRLKVADRRVQNFFDSGFAQPRAPDAPVVTAGAVENGIILTWTSADDSNNFADAYREFYPAGDPDNPYYEFEGYEVWQFESVEDVWPSCVDTRRCRLVQTFDVANGVTLVKYDEDGDENQVDEAVAVGTDSGVRHTLRIDGLVNYQSSHFGVRSYALNSAASPPIIRSSFSRVTGVPNPSSSNLSDLALAASADADSADIVATFSGPGTGRFSLNIVDPTAIRACDYRVVFYNNLAGSMANDVYCGEEKVIDGSYRASRFGVNLGVFDGLEYSLLDGSVGIRHFSVVANGNGPLDPPDMGTFAFGGLGYPELNGLDRPTVGYQQSGSDAVWGISVGGGDTIPSYASFRSRALRGDNLDRVGTYDYEMRFTSDGGKARRAYEDEVDIDVPFELWRTGINTPDDQSDDVRLIPFLCEEGCGAGTTSMVFDIGGNRNIPGGNEDPFTDWIYWNLPSNDSPGQAGYDAYFSSGDDDSIELFARTVLVLLNGGSAPPHIVDLPEVGTVFRIRTDKPILPGDMFSFSTAGYEPTQRSAEEKVQALDNIGVVPNPYKAASLYETTNHTDEVRFTNLPPEATIRVFTLNGTLIRTLRKSSPASWLAWDLKNEHDLSIASGLYLIHVEVPDVGSTVVKFSMATKKK